MCSIQRNVVLNTRPDPSGDKSRRGIGILASFQSEADIWENRLASNPVASGAIMNSQVVAQR